MSTHNRKVLEGLRRAAREGRLHHAYILSGPASVAKVSCVEEFAAGLFAEGGGGLFGATDPAQVLERIRSRNHPDFTRIEEPAEDQKDAKSVLDQVRELPRLLAFPPLEGARRIVLLPQAADLNDSSYNSILKILEEPPPHTMFFLLCRDPGELLQTIVSRCQVLRFAPLSDEEMLSFLGERAAGADQAGLLGWSEGAMERAEHLLGLEGANDLRREACERLLDLWEAAPRIPSNCVSWVEKVEGEGETRVVLDSWEILLRDLSFVASGAPASAIRFRDCFDRLVKVATKLGTPGRDEIPARAAAVNRFRVYRELNGNLRLDFAALLSELQIFAAKSASQA